MTTLRRRRGGDLRPTTGDGRNPPCVVDVAIASAVFQANPLSSSATVRTCGGGQHDPGNFTFGVSWKEIGDRAKPRTGKDAACAICREEFKTNATSRGQVLTSCAHCFHDACLKSFEQFLASISEERRCPCCRRGYRKIRIDEAKKEVVTEAAVTIQSAFRGFLVRNTLGPTNEIARKSWMAGKLRALRKRVERSAEKRRGDTLVDEDFSEASSSDEECDADIDWNATISKSLSYEDEDCSICARRFASASCVSSSTARSRAATKVAFLSCSHRFHKNCIKTFEKHLKSLGRDVFCPCCRTVNYVRKCL